MILLLKTLSFVLIWVMPLVIILPFLVVPAEAASTAENQQLEDPPSSRFTWTIENFSRLSVKKHYSETFIVGGYKWYLLLFVFWLYSCCSHCSLQRKRIL